MNLCQDGNFDLPAMVVDDSSAKPAVKHAQSWRWDQEVDVFQNRLISLFLLCGFLLSGTIDLKVEVEEPTQLETRTIRELLQR